MNRKINTELKKILIDRGLTQRELARATGMHEVTLSLIIRGVYVPSGDQQERIARILGKDTKFLFGSHATQ
jgi:transcriptional regulator with XRE-family HTH domain